MNVNNLKIWKKLGFLELLVASARKKKKAGQKFAKILSFERWKGVAIL